MHNYSISFLIRTYAIVFRVGLTIFVVSLSGCASTRTYSKIELHGVISKDGISNKESILLARGESVTLSDPNQVKAIVKHFPGMGTGRLSFFAFNSPPILELVFYDEVREPVKVYVRWDYTYWGSNLDKGDFFVCGDLREQLRGILIHTKVQDQEKVPEGGEKVTAK